MPSTAYGVSMMNGDYAKIAEGMGAVGITCTKVSELGPAFIKARELNAAGTTCLIQVQANVEERRSNNFKFADGVDSGERKTQMHCVKMSGTIWLVVASDTLNVWCTM